MRKPIAQPIYKLMENFKNMITNIKQIDSTRIQYFDGAWFKIEFALNEDNEDYIDIKFCEQQEMSIPCELIPQFIKALEKFKK